MRIKWLLIISLILGSGLVGCTSDQTGKPHQESVETVTESSHGDIREMTTNQQLPSFLNEKPENMQMLYTAVSQNQDVLENIPCYCGCGESVGHRNNYDCFIHENKADGSINWDDHATKCGVCLEIAAKAIIDADEGKSLEDIREEVEQTYQEDYAKPTPTPEI